MSDDTKMVAVMIAGALAMWALAAAAVLAMLLH